MNKKEIVGLLLCLYVAKYLGWSHIQSSPSPHIYIKGNLCWRDMAVFFVLQQVDE